MEVFLLVNFFIFFIVVKNAKKKLKKMFRCQRAQSKGVRETDSWKKMDTS